MKAGNSGTLCGGRVEKEKSAHRFLFPPRRCGHHDDVLSRRRRPSEEAERRPLSAWL